MKCCCKNENLCRTFVLALNSQKLTWSAKEHRNSRLQLPCLGTFQICSHNDFKHGRSTRNRFLPFSNLPVLEGKPWVDILSFSHMGLFCSFILLGCVEKMPLHFLELSIITVDKGSLTVHVYTT